MKKTKKEKKDRRACRTRKRIRGTAACPRFSVFRGLKTLSAQLIDDTKGVTLVSVFDHELQKSKKKKTKTQRAAELGTLLAHKASQSGITAVVFDRGGNAYRGRVRACAAAARDGGLVF